ncbi:molybdate ABC transporter substrate-binding protein [Tepidimonas sp.]|uniref:molybdate ABC transporter substrate-binding protein n=1 Tax=Tepidimonas sp. TaxID=2002775 RepID=UPI00345C1B55
MSRPLGAVALGLSIGAPAAAEQSAQTAAPVLLHTAGSARAALAEIADRFAAERKLEVKIVSGPAGALRERIEQGERAQVFASASMSHPEQLAAAGMSAPAVLFARNQICALTAPHIDTTPDKLLDTLLSDQVRLGVSTPKRDPLGDYTLQLFEKADAVQPGARARLEAKAQRLTGAPDSAVPPAGRNAYGWHVENGRADVFLTYCTNALQARKEVPALRIVAVPDALAVAADYGLTVLRGAPEAAWDLAMYILSPYGQAVLERYGFIAVTKVQK